MSKTDFVLLISAKRTSERTLVRELRCEHVIDSMNHIGIYAFIFSFKMDDLLMISLKVIIKIYVLSGELKIKAIKSSNNKIQYLEAISSDPKLHIFTTFSHLLRLKELFFQD